MFHCRRWDQAVDLAAERMSADSEGATQIVERVATHLIQAREYAKAADMYARTHLWDQAYDVAKTYLAERERGCNKGCTTHSKLLQEHAQQLSSTGDYKQACEAAMP